MLDTITLPAIEKDISNARLHPVGCYTALPKECSGYIEFIIPPTNENVSLFESFLNLELEITIDIVDKGVTSTRQLNTGDGVSIAPLLGSSMFSQVEVKLNNEAITDINPFYAYESYITAICDLSKTDNELMFSGSLPYFDTAGTMSTTGVRAAKDMNPNFGKRCGYISKGGFSISTPILSELFIVPRVLPENVDIRLKMYFHDPKFYIITDKYPKLHITLKNATLFTKKYKLSHGLSKTNFYPITNRKTKMFYVKKNDKSLTRNIVINSSLPRRAFVVQLHQEAFDGKFDSNPFMFNTNNISELYFLSDDKKFPLGIGYTPNFKKDYTKDYIILQKELGLDVERVFDRSGWKNDYTIFCTKFFQERDSNYVAAPTSGTLELIMKWKEPVKDDTVVLVILEYNKTLVLGSSSIEWR